MYQKPIAPRNSYGYTLHVTTMVTTVYTFVDKKSNMYIK